jgi:hypothetical protein
VVVPVALGVNVTEQLPLVRTQFVAGLNAPPVELNDTVPVGVLVVPGEVSVTVAVHVEPWFTATGDPQESAVFVVRRFTVIDVVPPLVAWVMSP